MFGEAVVFPRNNAPKHFYTMIKQHGAMLAKGWIVGIQFCTLFSDNLYFEISKNAIDRAEEMKKVIKNHGLKEYLFSPTNQQFVIIEDTLLNKIRKNINVAFWEKPDNNHTIVRFATSWYTKKDDIIKLDKYLSEIK